MGSKKNYEGKLLNIEMKNHYLCILDMFLLNV